MENAIKNEQQTNNETVEKCVFCGANTPYLLSTPIVLREHYVEGAGQLCEKCASKRKTV